MSSTFHVSQASMRTPPVNITATAIAAATSTGAIDLSAYQGSWVTFVAVTDTVYIRFGTSDVGAATTSHLPLWVGHHVDYFIPESGSASYFRAISTLAAAVHWAPSSDEK